MTKAKAAFSGEREVRTFADLNHGSDVLLEIAEKFPKGSYYTLMGSLLLSAFTFEAYLNHLGQNTFAFWKNVESVRVMDKYALLCAHFKVDIDWSKLPYQSLKRLFRFRNAIAHGQSVIVKDERVVDADVEPYELMPKAHWEEFCSVEKANSVRRDVSAVIKELHTAAGLGDYPFVHGSGVGSLSLSK